MMNKLKSLLKRTAPYTIVFTLILIFSYWMTLTPGSSSYTGPITPSAQNLVLAPVLREHVKSIATIEHNTVAWVSLNNSKNYIITTLKSMGFTPRLISFKVGQLEVSNIEVLIPADPQSATREQSVVMGAHYDSAQGAPGANDNATGVASLLETARYLKNLPQKPKYQLRLVFFVNEEPPYFQTPLMGSLVYAKDLIENQKLSVKAMYALDVLGAFYETQDSQHYPPPFSLYYPSKANFVAFVSTLGSRSLMIDSIKAFRQSGQRIGSQGVSAPSFVRGVDYSDHWAFSRYSVPSMMITDTAFNRYTHYHTFQDTVDKINFPALSVVNAGLNSMLVSLYY